MKRPDVEHAMKMAIESIKILIGNTPDIYKDAKALCNYWLNHDLIDTSSEERTCEKCDFGNLEQYQPCNRFKADGTCYQPKK